MGLLISLGVITAALIGWLIAFREKRSLSARNDEVGAERVYFQGLSSVSDFPDMSFAVPSYHPTKNEKVLEATPISEGRGWAIITDKAIVFETNTKNHRFLFNSVSKIEIFLDGVSVWRRSGSPLKFHLDFNARFLGLAAEILAIVRRS